MSSNKFTRGAAIIFLFTLACILISSSIAVSKTEPKLTKLWEATGFHRPESAFFDAEADIIYVSNVDGTPTEKDGKGFISKLSAEGKVISLECVSGLNAPK